MTCMWSWNTAEKNDAQAHTSVSGRQLQHALVSAVAAAGATLSAQRGSWKLGPPRAPRSSRDPSLPARGQHIRKDNQRGVLVCNIPTPYRVVLTCTKANSGSSIELTAGRTAILCCLLRGRLYRRYVPSATTDIYSAEDDRRSLRERELKIVHLLALRWTMSI